MCPPQCKRPEESLAAESDSEKTSKWVGREDGLHYQSLFWFHQQTALVASLTNELHPGSHQVAHIQTMTGCVRWGEAVEVRKSESHYSQLLWSLPVDDAEGALVRQGEKEGSKEINKKGKQASTQDPESNRATVKRIIYHLSPHLFSALPLLTHPPFLRKKLEDNPLPWLLRIGFEGWDRQACARIREAKMFWAFDGSVGEAFKRPDKTEQLLSFASICGIQAYMCSTRRPVTLCPIMFD